VAHLSWVVTAYVLAATITTPLYGKLGDQYGRKRLLMFAIVLFLIGSAPPSVADDGPAHRVPRAAGPARAGCCGGNSHHR
jgi:MFS family permease